MESADRAQPDTHTSTAITRTNSRSNIYHLHVELQQEYERLCKRNKPNLISDTDKHNYQFLGYKNIDLWVDGKLYPQDPLRKSTPPFRDVTSLLHFVGDGYRGLLGYTQSLEAQNSLAMFEKYLLEKENIQLKQSLEKNTVLLDNSNKTIIELQRKIEQLRSKQTKLGMRKREKKLKAIDQLKPGAGGIKKRIHAIRSLIQPEVGAEEVSGTYLSSLLDKKSMENLLENKKYKKVSQAQVQKFIHSNQLAPREIQSILDEASISNQGYSVIYKSLYSKLKTTNIKGSLLPNPTSIRSIRRVVDEEVIHLLRTPFHIEDTYSSPKGNVVFNSHNNVYELPAFPPPCLLPTCNSSSSPVQSL